MKCKPKYYIVYATEMIDKINWPARWEYKCDANLTPMLKEVLNTKSIGSEIKLIWNDEHRFIMLERNNITNQDLEDYLKSDCSMLSFMSKKIMNRTVKALMDMGYDNFVCVESYKNMLLQQIYYKRNKKFDTSINL